MDDLLVEVIKQAGPIAAIIIFFIWRDWKREERMFSRIEVLENFVQNSLLTLVQKVAETLQQNTKALERLEKLPCVLEKSTIEDEK